MNALAPEPGSEPGGGENEQGRGPLAAQLTAASVRLIARLVQMDRTVAVAESLTGGLLLSSLIAVPGASVCVRGGVVAYATDLKRDLLGVDADLLARFGPVHGDVATAMASGVREVASADVGIAMTGVAGPDPQDGHPVGTVFVAVATGRGTKAAALSLHGDRTQIRQQATLHALLLTEQLLR